MKAKVWIASAVLAMAAGAEAEFKLCVDGRTYPPQSSISVVPDESVIIGVNAGDELAAASGMIVFEGPAELDLTEMWLADLGLVSPGRQFIVDATDDADAMAYIRSFGLDPDAVVYFEIFDESEPPKDIPNGRLIDGIKLKCPDPGVVNVTLFDIRADRELDALTVDVVPEPATLALFGFGTLLVCRRRIAR